MILARSQNAKRNIVWGGVNKVILIFLPFIIRTVIIKELGIEYIGISSLFASILTILSLSELGFDSAVVFIMYNGVAKDDERQINALLAFIRKAYYIIGFVILMLGSLCLPFLNFFIKDATNLPANINLHHIYLVFLFSTSITYFFGGYRRSLINAYQRNDVSSNTISIISILFFVLQLFILQLTHSYYYYIYTIPISNILINTIIAYYSKRLFPNVKPVGEINIEEKKQLKKLVVGSFIAKVGDIMTRTLDNVIISIFLGITILGYYSNYFYVINALIGFLSIIYISIRGGMGNSVILETVEKNYYDLLKFNFLYSWIIGWFFYCCLFLYQPFIKLWIGDNGMLPDYIMILLCLFMYQSECMGIIGSYKAALGIVWEDRYRPFVAGLFNLVINVILVLCLRKYGEEYALIGVVLSSILSYALINCPWTAVLLFKKYFKTGLRECYLKTYLYFGGAILSALISYPFFSLFPPQNGTLGVFNISLRALGCLIIPNLLFFILYHKTNEFIEAKAFIKTRFCR